MSVPLPTSGMPAALRPSADELAVNRLYGRDFGAPPLPAPRTGVTTRDALEVVVSDALRGDRVFVLLDGSAAAAGLLVLAATIARRERLPEPVAITWSEDHDLRDDAAGFVAAEHALQQARLDGVERLDMRPSTVELLGEHARPLLQAHGVLVPSGWTRLSFPAARAAGGTLLTGFGLSAIASMPRRPMLAAVTSSRTPRPRDLRSAMADVAPPSLVRAAVGRSTGVRTIPWATPNARRRLAALEGRRAAEVPVRFDDALRALWVDRRYRASLLAMQLVGRATRTTVVSPFAEPAVLAALIGQLGGNHAREGALLSGVLGDLLPSELITAADQAAVALRTRLRRAAGGPRVWSPEPWGAAAVLGPRTRTWVQRWDGSGVDPSRIDAGALRRELLAAQPSPRAFAAIQQAWLQLGTPDLPE